MTSNPTSPLRLQCDSEIFVFLWKVLFFLRCFGEDFACVYACHCCVSALSLLVCSPGIAIVKNADAVWLTAGLVVDMKLKDTACLNLVGMCEDVW